jgi:hypothetical protein
MRKMMCFAKETDEENRKKDILLRMHRFREGTDVWPAKVYSMEDSVEYLESEYRKMRRERKKKIYVGIVTTAVKFSLCIGLLKSFGDTVTDHSRDKIEQSTTGACAICMEESSTILFVPCRHLAICSTCEPKYESKECPICRESVKDRIKVFLN